MQNAGQDFTVSGSTLTLTTAPDSGLTFFGVLLGQSLSLNTVADGSVGSSSLKSEDFTIGGSGNTVTIPGNLTVQGTETIINTNELNVQDKTIGIGSTNAPTSATQDGAGAIIYGQTHVNILYDVDKAALGINTGVSVAGFITATGLRSLGVTTCGAGLSLSDNVKAQFGDSGDLKIFHDGSHSYVQDGGTGDLLLDGSTIKLRNAGGSKNSIIANDGGDVQLNFDNTKRFETASDDEGGGIIVTGKIVGTAATIGSGVTINNTGIDLGIGGVGVITASRISGAGLTIADGRALVGIDTSEPLFYTGRVQVQGTNSSTSAITVKSNQNDSGGPAVVLGKSRATSAGGVTIVQDDDELGCIYFTGADGVDCTSQAAFIRGLVDGSPGSNDMPGRIVFGTAADGAATATERLRITSTGGFTFSNGALVEKVKITAGKLSDNQNIDLENGMVHYFTTQESTTATPNIRINSSTTLNSGMSAGDCISVTLVTTAAAGGYSANLTIDGNAVTEEWVGGSAPSEGSADGLDIYTYTIICIHDTSTGDSGFKVIANLTNATN